jgi:hypothetical protein
MAPPTKTYFTTMARKGLHFAFQEVRTQSIALPSGSSLYNLTLSAIQGNASMFFFRITVASPTEQILSTIIRPSPALICLMDRSQNLVGSRCLRTRIGSFRRPDGCPPPGFTEGAGYYIWCFTSDPQGAVDTSNSMGSYFFKGSEVLRLQFSSALGSAATLEFYALTSSAVEMTGSTYRKIPLTV